MVPAGLNAIGSWWKQDSNLLGPAATIQQPFLTYKQKRQRPPHALQCRPQSNTLLGLAGMQNPTLLACFGSVLGLTCQSDPTALGPATKVRLNSFWQRMSHPQPQFLTKKREERNAPQDATLLSTVQILYDIVSFTGQCVCVHSKSTVFLQCCFQMF